ncbi:MAG TPA: deoxyribose-phosphate aldolase, partial [Chitinophagaceae bacterium]|nr:deoxyribose-phosphate aldolase [Chitinophagaceae bacterium]
MSLAPYIDHTVLKPTTTIADIEQVCREAREFGFAAVCVPPYFVAAARALLDETPVKVATVIGFPFGYSHYKAKRREVKAAIRAGADEVDMVINLAALRAGDEDGLKKEAEAVSA